MLHHIVVASAIAAASLFLPIDATAQQQDFCQTAPIRTDAVDNPSKHAWQLFVWLNHPALDKTLGRGKPDCTKPLGEAGTTSVWETWRNAHTEVFLPDGSEPPLWDDISLPDAKPGTVPESVDGDDLMLSVHDFGEMAIPSPDTPPFSPEDGIFNDRGGFGETRMNQATFDFIRDQCLFSRQGQQRYAKAVAENKKPPISFPVEAIEVKAAWLDLEREGVPAEKWSTYYSTKFKGKTYGLAALHILTKDIPNWFWATFHHADNPANDFETEDLFGPPNEVAGTVWSNYKLGGTQIDFVDPTGKATLLSDHYVEFGFQKSSCITCHATATISETRPMLGQPKALCAIQPENMNLDFCKQQLGAAAFDSNNNLVLERGVPDPLWFSHPNGGDYIQTDFVFSIPFRGASETNPPPARCIW